MIIIFIILIVLAALVLSLIILVQNPKGGGLAGNVAGFSNQFMGVKQTTDVLEKGTWVFAGLIGLLCIISAMFIPQTTSSATGAPIEKTGTDIPVPASKAPVNNNTVPMQTTPVNPPAATPANPPANTPK